MTPGAKSFLQRWAVTALGVLAAANLVSGVRAESMISLLGASLLLGVLNAFLRPVLMLLSLPLLIFTFGLFTLVINALLLYFVATLVGGFAVDDFWTAFKGGLVISIVSMAANLLLGKPEERRERPARRKPPGRNPPPDTGSGPVIDV